MWSFVGRASFAALTTLGLLAIAACGGDESGVAKRYPVKGKITYKGELVKSGTIVFEPADPGGRVAQGNIEDGYYKLTTVEGDDGALPGDYKISIISKTLDMSKVEANRQGGAGRQDDVYKAEKAAKSNIPKKYERSDKSGLTYKVEATTNNRDFELTD